MNLHESPRINDGERNQERLLKGSDNPLRMERGIDSGGLRTSLVKRSLTIEHPDSGEVSVL